jgi:hypothetical protein
MGQNSNDAAVKDAQTKLRREECAGDMAQRSKDAALRDVRMGLSKEECAKGMEQRSTYTYAAAKDV